MLPLQVEEGRFLLTVALAVTVMLYPVPTQHTQRSGVIFILTLVIIPIRDLGL